VLEALQVHCRVSDDVEVTVSSLDLSRRRDLRRTLASRTMLCRALKIAQEGNAKFPGLALLAGPFFLAGRLRRQVSQTTSLASWASDRYGRHGKRGIAGLSARALAGSARFLDLMLSGVERMTTGTDEQGGNRGRRLGLVV